MIRKLISRFGVNHGCGGGTVAKAKTLRCEAFFQSDWRSKSVEQLSQLFLARHASGLEREHLGQMFYNECFTAIKDGELRYELDGTTPKASLEYDAKR